MPLVFTVIWITPFTAVKESLCDIGSLILITAHIPLFLYPFLHTVSKTRPFEYLRLTSLGVIGALVKVSFLLDIAVFVSAFLYTIFKHCRQCQVIAWEIHLKESHILFKDWILRIDHFKQFFCVCLDWWAGGHKLSSDNRNYSSVLTNYGIW